MEIKQDLLSHPEIIKLLNQHLDEMALHSPAESIHALDLESLKKPDLSFWSLWDQQQLLACGALKQLSSKEGEIKSMRTTPASRRKGVAKKMLQHIIDQAIKRNYTSLYLETGSMPAFYQLESFMNLMGLNTAKPLLIIN